MICVKSLELNGGPRWCSVRGGAEAGQAEGESGAEASRVKPNSEAVARGRVCCQLYLQIWKPDSATACNSDAELEKENEILHFAQRSCIIGVKTWHRIRSTYLVTDPVAMLLLLYAGVRLNRGGVIASARLSQFQNRWS
ncbi:hypothetical protein F2Q69_00018892 [Brassica cretica]|uniref:Uncharacterized protein n=1 Tax=Brassica cretica TaxID=69181 RepID=A0A8S9QLG1_BRACR|nr:hypothetical protein F2Q69_00018892 [Brassica cretica]